MYFSTNVNLFAEQCLIKRRGEKRKRRKSLFFLKIGHYKIDFKIIGDPGWLRSQNMHKKCSQRYDLWSLFFSIPLCMIILKMTFSFRIKVIL